MCASMSYKDFVYVLEPENRLGCAWIILQNKILNLIILAIEIQVSLDFTLVQLLFPSTYTQIPNASVHSSSLLAPEFLKGVILFVELHTRLRDLNVCVFAYCSPGLSIRTFQCHIMPLTYFVVLT